MGSTGMELT